jgi:hypothetical protein
LKRKTTGNSSDGFGAFHVNNQAMLTHIASSKIDKLLFNPFCEKNALCVNCIKSIQLIFGCKFLSVNNQFKPANVILSTRIGISGYFRKTEESIGYDSLS